MLIHVRVLLVSVVILLITNAHGYYIQSSHGDLVECVDKMTQRAFDNELLKNHKFQASPSDIPATVKPNKKSKWRTTEAHVDTAPCPEGTIPVLHESNDDTNCYASSNNTPVHEYAEGETKTPTKIYGMKATVNVWNPKVEDEEIESSISQVWIGSGSYEENNLNTIEIGWQVYPQLYNDNKPRLFTFWTNDTYQTGCYNLRCPGFVQTSRNVVLGGAITPISVFGGRQTEINILVWKDRKYGNWWLSLGSEDNSLVGYWPAELFTGLDPANKVNWGGEIVNSHRFSRHTKTQMGSGHFPTEGFGKASYFRNVEIIDYNNNLQPIPKSNIKTQISKYYKVKNLETDEGLYFFYGGTGLRSGGVVTLRSSLFFIYVCFSFFVII